MSLEEFKKEFYDFRLENWKNKYLKFKEMLHLIKLIRKDIKTHGGKINNNIRESVLTEEGCTDKLDRRSFNLGVLNDTEGIFDNNDEIFNSPVMYEIDKAYKEINTLQFEDDIKIFLYFLTIEVHNVYVFYLSIENEIYKRTNSYLHIKNKNKEDTEENVSNQLVELIDIAYLTSNFCSYIELNIEAVKYVLDCFDKNFLKINDGISIKKLFFNKNMLNQESDLKYILGFKIINECSLLLENYCYEIKNNFPKNKNIKEQNKELKEVLSYINEKNTIRVDDSLYEVYQKTDVKVNIYKKKENIDIDIQNSIFVDGPLNDLLEEEIEYDRQIKIKITNKNIINLILIFIYIFFYSFFEIIPYIVLFILCKKDEKHIENTIKKVDYYIIGIAITSTHLGFLIPKYIFSNIEKYKFTFNFFSICFCLSFTLTIMSFVFIFENISTYDNLLFSIFIIVSRFIYGLSGGKVIVRKYINLFLPESKIRFFSIIYLFINNLGYVFGIIILLIFLQINIDSSKYHIKINFITLPFIIGLFFSFCYLLSILFFFTEPNGDDHKMLTHQITIKDKEKDIEKMEINEQSPKEELTLINGDKDKSIKLNDKNIDKNIDKIPNDNLNSLESGQTIIYLDDDNIKDICNNINLINSDKEIKNDTQTDNLTNYISTSTKTEESRKRSFSRASMIMEEKLMSAKEIKGLNSIERAIISINNQSNFSDYNLFPKELEKIKHNQYSNDKRFFKTVLVLIFLLNISNMINEFFLLFIQLNIKIDDNKILNNICDNTDILKSLFLVIIMQLISFVITLVFIKSSIKRINKKLVVILNIFLILSLSGLLYCLIKKDLRFEQFFMVVVFFIFGADDLIIGLTSFFSHKIIPPFIKFYCFNVKYLLSYISTFGKLLGGIFFSVMMCLIEKNTFNNQKIVLTFLFILYDCFTIICFITLCLNFKSLKMRALSKLRAIQV